MKLSYVVLGLVIAGSLWSPGTSEVGPGEVARLYVGADGRLRSNDYGSIEQNCLSHHWAT